MSKKPDIYNWTLAIINGYEPIASNNSIKQSIITWMTNRPASGASMDDQILGPGTKMIKLIFSSIFDADKDGSDSDEETNEHTDSVRSLMSLMGDGEGDDEESYDIGRNVDAFITLFNMWSGKFSINIEPSKELSSDEMAVFEKSLKDNPAFCMTVDTLAYTASGNCDIVHYLSNLVYLTLSTNDAYTFDHIPTSPIKTVDLSQLNKLKEVLFYDRAFIGGWPKLPVNGILKNLYLDQSPMLYPPIFLPSSLKKLSVTGSRLVTLPNISRAKLPHLEQLSCDFDLARQNFTIATWITLRALQRHRQLVKISVSRGDVTTVEAQEFRLQLPELSRQILDDHFIALSAALIESIDNQTLEIPNVPNEVLFKLSMLTASISLPIETLNKIFAYCDLTPQQHIAKHLQSSATGLYDMLYDGNDITSIAVLEKYKAAQLPAQLQNAKQQLNICPGYSKYKDDYAKVFAKKVKGDAFANAITELTERANARKENMQRPKMPIIF